MSLRHKIVARLWRSSKVVELGHTFRLELVDYGHIRPHSVEGAVTRPARYNFGRDAQAQRIYNKRASGDVSCQQLPLGFYLLDAARSRKVCQMYRRIYVANLPDSAQMDVESFKAIRQPEKRVRGRIFSVVTGGDGGRVLVELDAQTVGCLPCHYINVRTVRNVDVSQPQRVRYAQSRVATNIGK